ncbi:SCO family protein [Bacillus kwashiorkori]|uniref:SCO family protein n=1 Tax=Bacillus kwashiorkori TaxID=1522318 RepID=UPI000784FE6A|nr:SCO family protein [Bacillus kwashiorkori]
MKGIKFFFVLLLISSLLLTGCSSKKIENEKNWPIESFEHINQDGEKLSLSDLKGKIWIANFIFTNCTTVCSPITANMARIQQLLAENDLQNVEIISFSIDPEVDTPEQLKSFAANFTEDLSNWHFLTGYVQPYIEQFAKDNFHLFVLKPEDDDQVMHGTDFFLVDQQGVVVKYYSALDIPYEELLQDIEVLVSRGSK